MKIFIDERYPLHIFANAIEVLSSPDLCSLALERGENRPSRIFLRRESPCNVINVLGPFQSFTTMKYEVY